MASNHSNSVTFVKADDGEFYLERDWKTQPPTVIECESLYANLALTTRILTELIRHVADGRLVIASDLAGSELDEVMGFLKAVQIATTPTTGERKE